MNLPYNNIPELQNLDKVHRARVWYLFMAANKSKPWVLARPFVMCGIIVSFLIVGSLAGYYYFGVFGQVILGGLGTWIGFYAYIFLRFNKLKTSFTLWCKENSDKLDSLRRLPET